jgi:2-oxoglutarate dehydrogenase E1 component
VVKVLYTKSCRWKDLKVILLTAPFTSCLITSLVSLQIQKTADHVSLSLILAPYCTDVFKTINSFVIHINADYPEHVDFAFKLAVEYRMKFKRDVMVDITGYRRLGHNEHDSPKFTQPKVYERVDNHPKLMQIYAKQLISEGVFTKEEVDLKYKKAFESLSKAYDSAKAGKPVVEKERDSKSWSKYLGKWNECKEPAGPPTKISEQTFKTIGHKINTLPEGRDFHPLAVKVYEARMKAIETGHGLDWGAAEALAFGTLLDEGYGIRLSGEDVRRGTFSHRHACLIDQKSFEHFYPLNQAQKNKDSNLKFKAYNSLLSEYGVVGFDYGYSLGSPDCLTIWEAQFGDFSNVAQPVIDLYLANGEVKWGLKSGMVMLLPHGLDGQGPEHSSSRVERYLQMLDDDIHDPNYIKDDDMQVRLANYSVCNITEPANFFHVIRRQLLREYRKPLIVLTPKRLLRLKEAKNDMDAFTKVDRFRTVLPDGHPEDANDQKSIKKLYLCTGQLYYELLDKRRATKRKDIGIIRLEQIGPFPFNEVEKHLRQYPNAEVYWVQEEPANQAFLTYVQPRLDKVLKKLNRPQSKHISRKVAAASAPGSTTTHKKQQEELLNNLFK